MYPRRKIKPEHKGSTIEKYVHIYILTAFHHMLNFKKINAIIGVYCSCYNTKDIGEYYMKTLLHYARYIAHQISSVKSWIDEVNSACS